MRITVGQTYNRLTAVAPAHKRFDTDRQRWTFDCLCGERVDRMVKLVLRGDTKSCGCLSRETLSARSVTHGMSGTAEYFRWRNMLNRCYNPNVKSYKDYGGRGITVCARWRASLSDFLTDTGPHPDGVQIDRIDPNGDYSPGNCRWVTQTENERNKRNVIHVSAFGETMTIKEWAERTAIKEHTIYMRLRRGVAAEVALCPA